MIDPLASVGLSLKMLAPAVVGSLVSLRFFPALTVRERCVTFLSGVAISAYGTIPLVEWLELKPSIAPGIALLLALFGMPVTAALIKVIQETDWIAIVKKLTGQGGT